MKLIAAFLFSWIVLFVPQIIFAQTFKNDINKTHPEHGGTPYIFDLWDALEIGYQRIGNLVFDHLRTTAHPLCENDHLVLAEIGNCIYWIFFHGVNAIGKQAG